MRIETFPARLLRELRPAFPSLVSHRGRRHRSRDGRLLPILGAADPPAPKIAGKAEALISEWFKSLTEEQRKAVAFDYHHPDRLRVENNWHIVEQRVGKIFHADQQAMVREIFSKLHSEEYGDKVMQQFTEDNKGKGPATPEAVFGTSSCAIFGSPGAGPYEFVFTGRHCTRRCDGDSESGVAFGGPIFYGHAAQGFYEKADHAGNVYWYQAKQANALFEALDGKQRNQALRDAEGREERGTDTVKLTRKKEGLEGIAMADLTADQKVLAQKSSRTCCFPSARKTGRGHAIGDASA
ncbi:MAG: DUF3500 domain-containing protein [Verrucomicrobiales bacterium]